VRGAAAALTALAALVVAGCGERDFTATGLVEAANEEGAQLTLGEALTTSEAGAEIHAITTAPAGGANPQLEGSGGKGTLVVTDDAASGSDEFERCESAADLTCFRVANVVLRFESLDAPDQARVSGAIAALASDG
jgi:hypothetical protein